MLFKFYPFFSFLDGGGGADRNPLAMLNHKRFPWAHFLSSSRSLWMAFSKDFMKLYFRNFFTVKVKNKHNHQQNLLFKVINVATRNTMLQILCSDSDSLFLCAFAFGQCWYKFWVMLTINNQFQLLAAFSGLTTPGLI